MAQEFNAEHWFLRLKHAGGVVRVDGGVMSGPGSTTVTPEIEAIWAELQGPHNKEKWREVDRYMERVAGSGGWVGRIDV
jgi:hypothetical protein